MARKFTFEELRRRLFESELALEKETDKRIRKNLVTNISRLKKKMRIRAFETEVRKFKAREERYKKGLSDDTVKALEEVRVNTSLEPYQIIKYKCSGCGKEVVNIYSSLEQIGKQYCRECNRKMFNNTLIQV